MVGTEQWNLAKSKVKAAQEFSRRIKEEHQYLKQGRQSSAKEDLQRRLLEFRLN